MEARFYFPSKKLFASAGHAKSFFRMNKMEVFAHRNGMNWEYFIHARKFAAFVGNHYYHQEES